MKGQKKYLLLDSEHLGPRKVSFIERVSFIQRRYLIIARVLVSTRIHGPKEGVMLHAGLPQGLAGSFRRTTKHEHFSEVLVLSGERKVSQVKSHI